MQQIGLRAGFVECKATKLGLAALSKLKRHKDMPPHLYFFNVMVYDADKGDMTYRFACLTEGDRTNWLSLLKKIGMPDHMKSEQAMNRRHGKEVKRELTPRKNPLGGSRGGHTRDDDEMSVASHNTNVTNRTQVSRVNDGIVSPSPGRPPIGFGTSIRQGNPDQYESVDNEDNSKGFDEATLEMMGAGEDGVEKERRISIGICSVKVTNIIRFFEVLLGYPGILLVDSFGPANKNSVIYSKQFVYLTNTIVMYVMPILISTFVLAEAKELLVEQLVVGGLVLCVYVLPSFFSFLYGVYQEWRYANLVNGFFSFKPSHHMKLTVSNVIQVFGILFEWIQIGCMMLPKGLYQNMISPRVVDYFPHISYDVCFWVTVGLTYLSSFTVMLPVVLRGKTLYKYLRAKLPWNMLYFIGNVLFLSMCVILFMSLHCNYDVSPPVFVQDPTVQCYKGKHRTMATVGIVTLGFCCIQHILLPVGSFKETISESVDVVFTPKYLTVHTLLKVVFAGVFVFFYHTNIVRVSILTFIAFLMLAINHLIRPCCVAAVNLMRDTCFAHASIIGTMSIGYMIYQKYWFDNYDVNGNKKWLYLYIMSASLVGVAVLSFFTWIWNRKNTENVLASQLVDIENNPDGTGSSCRALQPLVALALSEEVDDRIAARKYVSKLISFMEHKSERVQFMALWTISTMALEDEEARAVMHEGGATKIIMSKFDEYTFICQVEALAALANMSLCDAVSESLVRQFNGIPFIMAQINGHSSRHSLFALVCLGNLTRREQYREQIRVANGIQTLVTCLMSHDYQKRKFGVLALSNMALSVSEEMDSIFKTRGLIERVVKMSKRQEVETQKEVVALVRNMACHSRLRPVLLSSGIMTILHTFRASVHKGVAKWADEIYALMQLEITQGSLEEFKGGGTELGKKSAVNRVQNTTDNDREYMRSFSPLHAKVAWSTWGSRLGPIFEPLLAEVPPVNTKLPCETGAKERQLLNLSVCMPTSIYVQWRNDAKYVITRMPIHGNLTHSATYDDCVTGVAIQDTDSVVYTPSDSLMKAGTDSFSYYVQLGGIHTKTCTISISCLDSVEMKTRRPYVPANTENTDDYDDSEYGSVAGDSQV